MLVSPNPQPPAPNNRPKVTTDKVSDIPFDRGEEYYNGKDGHLAARPATKGLIYMNIKTFQACDDKIEAIKNRVANLESSGVEKRDADGNFHYKNDETGESVRVETKDGATTYEQSLTTHEREWLIKHVDTTETETFVQNGAEVSMAANTKKDEGFDFLIFHSHDTGDLTLSGKYRHVEGGGFESGWGNEWKPAQQ